MTRYTLYQVRLRLRTGEKVFRRYPTEADALDALSWLKKHVPLNKGTVVAFRVDVDRDEHGKESRRVTELFETQGGDI